MVIWQSADRISILVQDCFHAFKEFHLYRDMRFSREATWLYVKSFVTAEVLYISFSR